MRGIISLALFAILLAGCAMPGGECSKDSDCPQPKCMGIVAKCNYGTCVAVDSNGTIAKCAEIPNPAAKYCTDKGYQYKIETDTEGGQRGYCYVPLVPPSGDIPGYTHKCEEWSFYRGECPACKDYCELRPHIACVGYWNISGRFPNCNCQYICSTTSVCSSDSDCPSGYACYNSRFCGLTHTGGVCGDQEGDLLCHKQCSYNSDCSADMPYCRDVRIVVGDTITSKRMCMRQECEADSDCPQPNCAGMKGTCVDGKCRVVDSIGNPSNCMNEAMGKELCEKYGGRWNECGSACTGMPAGTVCPAVCIAQCECLGATEWKCPPGYYCRLAEKQPDSVGVCTAERA